MFRSVAAPSVDRIGPIAPPPAADRLTVRDQLHAIEWQEGARQEGWRVALWLQDAELRADGGDMLSVHRADAGAPAWMVARRGTRFTAWSAETGHAIGRFRSVREALDAIARPPLS
jgi:hypothetical protein